MQICDLVFSLLGIWKSADVVWNFILCTKTKILAKHLVTVIQLRDYPYYANFMNAMLETENACSGNWY